MACQRKSCKQNLHQPVLEASQRLDNLDKIMMGQMNEWERGAASRLCKTAVDSLSLFKMCFIFFFQSKNKAQYFCLVHLKIKVLRRRGRETTFCCNHVIRFSHNLTAQNVQHLRIYSLRAARFFNLFSKYMKDLLNVLP